MSYGESKSKAATIAFEAVSLYPVTADRVKEYGNEPFTMYSFDALARRVIEGIAFELYQEGCSTEQVKTILSSKLIRWKLDAHEEDLFNLGKKWAKDENWKNEFKGAK